MREESGWYAWRFDTGRLSWTVYHTTVSSSQSSFSTGRTRPRTAYLVSTAVHVLRRLRQPSKTQRCYSALRLVDAKAAMPNEQSLAVTVVSSLEGIPEMRLAMQWSGFAKIRSAKFDQHPHSFRPARNESREPSKPVLHTSMLYEVCI